MFSCQNSMIALKIGSSLYFTGIESYVGASTSFRIPMRVFCKWLAITGTGTLGRSLWMCFGVHTFQCREVQMMQKRRWSSSVHLNGLDVCCWCLLLFC